MNNKRKKLHVNDFEMYASLIKWSVVCYGRAEINQAGPGAVWWWKPARFSAPVLLPSLIPAKNSLVAPVQWLIPNMSKSGAGHC